MLIERLDEAVRLLKDVFIEYDGLSDAQQKSFRNEAYRTQGGYGTALFKDVDDTPVNIYLDVLRITGEKTPKWVVEGVGAKTFHHYASDADRSVASGTKLGFEPKDKRKFDPNLDLTDLGLWLGAAGKLLYMRYPLRKGESVTVDGWPYTLTADAKVEEICPSIHSIVRS